MKIYSIVVIHLFVNIILSQESYQIPISNTIENFEGTTIMLTERRFYNPPQTPNIPSFISNYKLFSFDLNYNQGVIDRYLIKKMDKIDSIIFKKLDINSFSQKKINHVMLFLSGRTKDNSTKIIIPDRNYNLDFTDDTILTFDLTKNTKIHEEFDNFEGKNLSLSYDLFIDNSIQKKNINVKFFHHDSTVSNIYGNIKDKDYVFFIRQNERKRGIYKINNTWYSFFVQPYIGFDEYAENFYLYTTKYAESKKARIKYYTKDSLIRIEDKLYQISLSKYADTLFLNRTNKRLNEYELSKEILSKIFTIEKKVLNSTKLVHLNEFKGKYVLINFWGTWCKPCIEDLPAVQKIYKNIDNVKIKLIGVSCDYDSSRVKHFLNEKQYFWDNVFENIEAQDEFNWSYLFKILEYPHWVLINPNGEIIKKGSIPIDKLLNILDVETKSNLSSSIFPKLKD